MNSNTITALIQVGHVSHTYDTGSVNHAPALHNLSMIVREREIVGLLGRSGSGKSTLLRIIAGLIQPDEGDVKINGKAIDGPDPDLAMVFQTFALFPWLTVYENVALGLEAKGIPQMERHQRTLAAIDLIGLDGYESAYPRELSGGMRQRVGIARALVVLPKVLLMDEPFSALDVLTAETLRTDLIDLWAEGKMPIAAILMVTHNIEEAVLMCDRLLIMTSHSGGAHSGAVIREIKISLPRPRHRLDPAFRLQVDQVYASMTPVQGVAGKILPMRGIGIPLQEISSNELSGLMEALVTPPFEGHADLPPLATQLLMEVDELFPIAEALAFLGFAEIADGDIKLLDAGKRFVDLNINDRKTLFAQHLHMHVPLISHIKHILEERHSHEAPKGRFRDELEDYMPPESAEETLRTIISWARYGEVFAYDEDSGTFSFDNPS